MRRIPRKYVLIFLAFLTTLLCMVGSSTWIILSQKTSDPTKREKLDLTFSVESISEATPIFYYYTVSTANNTFELVNAVAKINNTETTVKGTFNDRKSTPAALENKHRRRFSTFQTYLALYLAVQILYLSLNFSLFARYVSTRAS